jgi:hypothetical protein
LGHGLFHKGVLSIGGFWKDKVIVVDFVVIKETSVGAGAGEDARKVVVAVVVITVGGWFGGIGVHWFGSFSSFFVVAGFVIVAIVVAVGAVVAGGIVFGVGCSSAGRDFEVHFALLGGSGTVGCRGAFGRVFGEEALGEFVGREAGGESGVGACLGGFGVGFFLERGLGSRSGIEGREEGFDGRELFDGREEGLGVGWSD